MRGSISRLSTSSLSCPRIIFSWRICYIFYNGHVQYLEYIAPQLENQRTSQWRTPEHLSWRTREPEITSAQMENISFGEMENTSVGELENISVWFFPCSPNIPHNCQFFTQLQFEANPIETQSHTQQKCVNHEVQCFSLHSVMVIVIWVLPGGGRTRLWRGKVSGVGFSSQRQNLTYLRNMIESTYFILKQREKEIHLL